MTYKPPKTIVQMNLETLSDPAKGINSALKDAQYVDGSASIPYCFCGSDGLIVKIGASEQTPKGAYKNRMSVRVDENLRITGIYLIYSRDQVSDTGHENLQKTQEQYRYK